MFNEVKVTEKASALSQLLNPKALQETNEIEENSDKKSAFSALLQQLSDSKNVKEPNDEETKEKKSLKNLNIKELLDTKDKTEVSKSPVLLQLLTKSQEKTTQVDVKNKDKILADLPTEKIEKSRVDAQDNKILSQLLSTNNFTQEEKSDIKYLTIVPLQEVTVKEVKQLINDAKAFLQDKIRELRTDTNNKDIPKTVKGLLKVAKQIGIQVESITLKQITPSEKKFHLATPLFKTKKIEMQDTKQINTSTISQLLTKDENLKNKSTVAAKREKSPLQSLLQVEGKKTPDVQEVKNTQEVKTSPKVEGTKTPNVKEVKNTQEVKTSPKVEGTKTPDVQEVKNTQEVRTSPKVEGIKTPNVQEVKNTQEVRTSPKVEGIKTPNIKEMENIQELKTPTNTVSQNKIITDTQVNGKENIQATLSALLKTDKKEDSAQIKNETKHKVKPTQNDLTSLLHGIKSETNKKIDQNNKLETIQAIRNNENANTNEIEIKKEPTLTKEQLIQTTKLDTADQLKSDDAKTLVKHFSTNFKEAVDNYKSPFTRLTMKLNPEKLGALDLTMVQRGKNLHINISSNDKALTMLSQNVLELKQHLSQVGINNASINFNGVNINEQMNQTSTQNSQQSSNQNPQNNANQSFSQNSGSGSNSHSSGQQGQERQHQHYKDQMNEESLQEEKIELEIILPRYI